MPEYVTIDYDDCLVRTQAAVRLRIDKTAPWIPCSVLDPEEELPQRGDGAGEVLVARWFAEKEGLV